MAEARRSGGGAGGGSTGGGGEIARLSVTVTADASDAIEQLRALQAVFDQTAQIAQSDAAKIAAVGRAYVQSGRSYPDFLQQAPSMGFSAQTVRDYNRMVQQELAKTGEQASSTADALGSVGAVTAANAQLTREAQRQTQAGGALAGPGAAAVGAVIGTRLTAAQQIAASRAALGPVYGGGATQAQQILAAQPAPTPNPTGAGGGAGGGVLSAFGVGTPGGMLRAGTAALFGFTGLNIAATTLEHIRALVGDIFDSQYKYEQSLRATRGIYGDMAPQVERVATAMANMPDVLGTQEQFQRYLLQTQPLTRFGAVTPLQQAQLVLTGQRLANTFRMSPGEQDQLQANLRQVAQGGGTVNLPSGAQITVDPRELAAAMNLRAPEALGALTPDQLTQARTALVTAQSGQFVEQARQQQAGLLDTQASLQQRLDNAQSNLNRYLESNQPIIPYEEQPPRPEAHLDVLDTLFGGPGGVGARGLPPTTPEAREAQTQYEQAVKDATDALAENNAKLAEATSNLGDQQNAIAQATEDLRKLGIEAGGATGKLLAFTGSLEDASSIARGDVARQAQAAVAQRAVVNEPGYLTPAEQAATARQQAEERVYQQWVAQQAQGQPSAIRDFFQRQTQVQGPSPTGQPVAAQAQAALDQMDQQQAVQEQLVAAHEASQQARIQQANAGYQAQQVSFAIEANRLANANRLAEVQQQILAYQEKAAPLLLQQATLEANIERTLRGNLDVQKQLVDARIAALGPTRNLEDLDRHLQRNALEGRAIAARLSVGQGSVEDLQRLDALRADSFRTAYEQTQAALPAFDAQTDQMKAQRASEDDQLKNQKDVLDNYEAQRRSLHDQLTDLGLATQATQDIADAITRSQRAYELSMTPAKTVADWAVLQAQAAGAAADQEERYWRAIEQGLQLPNLSTLKRRLCDVGPRIRQWHHARQRVRSR
jgi:hypothetical protein